MIKRNRLKIDLKIGTSGYSYDDWRGTFYPPEIPQNKMLEFYCLYFQTVELNATYYTIPSSKTFERIAQKTPESFEFIIKMNRESTHFRRSNATAIQKLLASVQPLIEAKKFNGFLAQFPYSFKNEESNRKYLLETKRLVGDHPIFVEFRNYTWLNAQIPIFLEDNNIGYVNVDQPQLTGLLPPQDLVTNKTGYIRLHGRNEKTWWDGQGSERYNYEYNEEELNEWLVNISNILRRTFKSYIFFNNHPTGNSVKNAQQMMELIKAKLS